MFPNQQPVPTPPPTQQPVDYLNQIAPQVPKKQLFKPSPRLFIIIGAALVLLVVILAITVNVVVASQRRPLQQLAVRLTETATVVSDAQTNLKSSQLRSLNSNLKIYLTNTDRDITAPLSSAGVKVDKISDSIKQEESSSALTGRLEDARLNAVYDRTYAREMAYRLDTILTLMKEIYSSTGSSDLKSFLNSAYTNLEPTQKGFADFQDASS